MEGEKKAVACLGREPRVCAAETGHPAVHLHLNTTGLLELSWSLGLVVHGFSSTDATKCKRVCAAWGFEVLYPYRAVSYCMISLVLFENNLSVPAFCCVICMNV